MEVCCTPCRSVNSSLTRCLLVCCLFSLCSLQHLHSHITCVSTPTGTHTPTNTHGMDLDAAHMHLHKLHTKILLHTRKISMENPRKSDCCLAYQQSNSQCWTLAMRYVGKAPSFLQRSHRIAHIDFVLLLKCANQKTEHAYQCALFFRFHHPSVFLVRSNASDTRTQMQTQTRTYKLLLYRAHAQFVSYLARCACVCIQRKVPFALLHVMHGFCVLLLLCVIKRILRWIMSMKIRYRACVSHWCAEYRRLTDHRSKRRKGAIIYQMITS